ncbi:hypothetical protein AB0M19_10595 [Streptomyces sp. NPDC051920]|uniref:hypothetical protein n=1 Tax=Streptomyces sp. NPDC051920 TaxID=3155523 RepID=UPI00343FC319
MSDDYAEAEVIASYVTGGPEQFLHAIVSLAQFDLETRAEFEGEPQVYRWLFAEKAMTPRFSSYGR